MLIGGREAVKTGPRVALVAGGSGLTGHALLRLMLQQQVFERVIALSRRPLPLEHARFANRILRFDQLESSLKGMRCTDAFCALGAAGGPRAQPAQLQAVDLDLVLSFARAARQAGAARLVVVSAAGADKAASTPFLRVKGEMEVALRPLGFEAIDILQPGAVFGSREGGVKDLLREGMLALASPLLRRSKASLNAISGADLAAAMLGVAVAGRPGIRTYAGENLTRAAFSLRTAP